MVYPKFNKLLSFLSVFLITLFSAFPFLQADEKNSPPKVVVTIKPLHSLVSGVMKGVGEPTLLLKDASSPHHFQLKPSDALAIKKADLIVRVGPNLETPMNKVLKSLSNNDVVLNAVDLDGITFYKMRSKHEHHGHDDHDDHKEKHAKHEHHDDHDDHKKEHAKHDHHDDHDDHKKEHAKHDHHDDHDDHKKEHAKHDHHDDHDDHKKEHAEHDHHDDQNSLNDPHIWLHPDNAKTIAFAVAKKLVKLDPDNSKNYQKNAMALAGQLDKLSLEITALMKPLDDQSYMVFHDAYQYLTKPHDLHFAGAITFNPGTPPSAKHLKELIKTLKDEKVVCIFSEVQYNPKLVKTLSEGHKVKTAVLDPIGAKLNAGTAAYFTMMKNLSTEINKCMKP
ncbi:MAG: zinc ABC transporter substrate-binding protein [Rhodomicrobiaceae bacterium]